jgi:hypothetical protein
MSLLTNKKYIPTFSLQRLVHLLPHIPCQHNCYLPPTKVVHKYNKDFLMFFQFWTKEWIAKTMKLLEEIIPTFPMKTNSFYESLNKLTPTKLEILVLYPQHGCQMLGRPSEFGYLIRNQYKLEHLKSTSV